MIAVIRTRRSWLALGLCAVSTWAAAQAPAAPVTIRALGVYALLGDEVQVTVADAPAASRIERSARQSLVVKSIGFDNIVLRAVRDTAERYMPGMALQMFRSNTVMPAADQRSLVEGARGGALPAWITQTIAEHKLSHLLLVTRQRADTDLRTADGTSLGRGKVDGLGFYLDPMYAVRNTDNGIVSQGALGPFVVVQLTLMDAQSGEIVRSYTINEQSLVGPRTYGSDSDPWAYLSPQEKAEILRQSLQRSLARVMPSFLAGR